MTPYLVLVALRRRRLERCQAVELGPRQVRSTVARNTPTNFVMPSMVQDWRRKASTLALLLAGRA